MYKLYTITKEKSGIRGFWKAENGKIYRDKITIENYLSGLELYHAKKALFALGEKAVFYLADKINSAIIENENGKKDFLRHKITWNENKLRPSLVKALLFQHGGLTIFKNENDYTIEIWKA
jgi:hypothetical protein